MSYIIKKAIKGKKYFYLVSSFRVNKKVKKLQLYLGTNKPSLNKLSNYSRKLKKLVENYIFKFDPLIGIISRSDLKKLEKIKNNYKKILKQSSAVQENYYEWFVTTYTYNTNAIEGSALTLHETAMVLFEGISPSGRPLRDIIAAENHKRAFDWMFSYKGDINKQFILKLHRILTNGILNKFESGKIRNVQVYVRGANEIPPKPNEVEPQLKSLIKWYKNHKKKYHPAVLSSYFHTAFEGIHPFVDFNGRTGRLLLNFTLIKNGYPPIDIRNKNRQNYYNAIKAGLNNNLRPFIKLVVKYLKESEKKW